MSIFFRKVKRRAFEVKKAVFCGVSFLRENPRYFSVAVIFAAALWYHFFVAIEPEKESAALSADDAGEVKTSDSVAADLDIEHPFRRYERLFLSRPGDWYRVSVSAEAFDRDETLSISLVSPLGERQSVGNIRLLREEKEKWFEFSVETNGSYEDVLIEKILTDESGANADTLWQGGRVRLDRVLVSRLSVRNAFEAARLLPSVFGERDVRTALTNDSPVPPVFEKKDAHFLFGQVLEVSKDSFASAVRFRLEKTGGMQAKGKYRLEVREYDSITGRVTKKALQRVSFSEKGLKPLRMATGEYRLSIPFNAVSGKAYFIGISDDYVKSGARIALSSFPSESADGSSDREHWFSVEVIERGERDSDRLLSDGVVEDMGDRFRYRSRLSGSETDAMDVFESSEEVSFDESSRTVSVGEKKGSFLTYRVDLLKPFSLMRIEATGFAKHADKFAFEYSFDNNFWKAFAPRGESDEDRFLFDQTIRPAAIGNSIVYVRVRFTGSEKESGSLGLSDLRFIAEMPKEGMK